ncbi:MAG: dihydroneopterin triphosphate pyrophosphatase [candidate division WS6 bacterium OLB20]|uniref:Dihydroneopterin triphosphate pyrophosphatase n=1 Tax=candidate division WS6 bacterium OLB20 TaxID=1617426 RepID=A0A136LZI2_9BACT|nr:MAG: dihydroneopterin triphosphate pyrophosphatase [candidate division WS6 bacterium OLB20]
MPHIHDHIDFTVATFVVFDSTVLLRYHDKYDFWGVPSGHIELDEDPAQAALRECLEESGLTVTLYNPRPSLLGSNQSSEVIPPLYVNRHRISDTHEHVEFIYFASSETDAVDPREESDRSEQFVWVDAQALKEMDLKDDIRFYAQQALFTLKPL